MATTEVSHNTTSCTGAYVSFVDCHVGSNGLLTTAEFGMTLLVMVVVIMICLFNNMCVIYVIIRAPHLRRQLSYVFVLNLCVVDILASVLVLPFMILSYVHGQWPFEEEFCLAQGFLVSFFIILSTMSICTISVDRLYSIKSPMHYAANMTLGRVMYAILTIWVYALVISVVPIFDREGYTFQETKMYCFLKWSAGWNHSSYTIAFSVLSFVIPCIVIVIMYIGIYRVARKTATQIRPMPTPSPVRTLHPAVNGHSSQNNYSPPQPGVEGTISKPNIAINGNVQSGVVHNPDAPIQSGPDVAKSNKAVKTLMIIILTFVVVWAPFFVFNIHCSLNHGLGCSASGDLWTSILGFASFAVNPLVYGIMNRSVREETFERLRQVRYCCRHNPDAEDGPGNEDFFEFLERTSVAQAPRAESLSDRKSKSKRSKMAVVCGAKKAAGNDLHIMTVHSVSSMC